MVAFKNKQINKYSNTLPNREKTVFALNSNSAEKTQFSISVQ